MAFLTIAGAEYPVPHGNATEEEPTRVGGVTRAFAGNARGSVRESKRRWQFTLGPLWQFQYDVLRTSDGAAVTVAGEAMGGVNVPAIITLGAAPYVPDDPHFRRMVTVTVLEV